MDLNITDMELDLTDNKMRLIDANALEPDTEWNSHAEGFLSYYAFQISCAPTIDAVSVVYWHWIHNNG